MSDEDDAEHALAAVVRALPRGGEARSGQVTMARGVAGAIARERHLVVRAGTGTGKSLAYLVPAALSGQRVLVVTATKALQDQLATRDLPQVEQALAHPFRFAVLKGRSNYLCAQRLVEGEAAGEQGVLGEEPGRSRSRRATQAKAVVEWAATADGGDRAELPFEVDDAVWSSFSVAADECPGAHRCPSGGRCFAEAARARAADADVVVANLHLLGAHLAAGEVVLPPFDVLVVDEAHELEEVLSSSLGSVIGAGRLRALVAAARRAGAGANVETVRAAGDRVIDFATELEAWLATRADRRLDPALDDELAAMLGVGSSRLAALEEALGGLGDADEGATLSARARLAVARLREELDRVPTLDASSVVWVEGRPRPTLRVAPLDVGGILAERVFGAATVVLTSATIPPGLASRLGAEPGTVDELDVGSPFEFEEHALLYCAAHLPDRRRPESEGAIHEELERLIRAAGGRTLALFTSRRAMEVAAAACRERLDLPIVVQGEGERSALLGRFRDEPELSLFATMGFWQGIDVPGPSLSLVVIDRLPFGRPDDPLLAARREHAGPDAFRQVDLPRAAALLAQGAGRLIRTNEDRGVVAVLDPRLASASYRWDLVRALPPMRRTKAQAEVEGYLRRLREVGADH